MKKHILSLDQGTTSSRAIIFNLKGEALASHSLGFKQYYPAPGLVEHDASEILSTQLEAARRAYLKSGLKKGDIAAIGITNQRETTILWDKKTGEPIHKAIVWQCRRTADICKRLIDDGMSDFIKEKTGLTVDAYFSATKIKWLLDNIKGAREKANRGEILFGTVDSYLIYNLTGGKLHAIDYTNASRTMLFDIEKLDWCDELLKALDIPRSILPTPMPSSCIYANVAPNISGLEELEGVPIAGVAGDQQAALFGQSCFLKGEAKVTYGTGCFLMLNTGANPVKSKNGLLSTIAWSLGGDKPVYALEGSVFNAGSVIQWLRDDLGLISSAPEIDELASTVPDTGGVYMVPAFTGLGAPYWDMYARGIITGLTRGTKKAHIARAVLEGIAYQVKDIVIAMEHDCGFTLKGMKADGGASVSVPLMQFQSDILNKDISRASNVEATALGAAYLAGLGTGLYKDTDELRAITRDQYTFTPAMSQDQIEQKHAGYKAAVKLVLRES